MYVCMYVCIYIYIYIYIYMHLPADGGAALPSHRLPDRVRTNVCFIEVPQYTIIMT